MIKGLTPRFAEVGKIKIGGKGKQTTSANGKKFNPPVRFDHFVVTTTERDADGNFIADADMMKRLIEHTKTDKPREIPIRLPFDSIDLNFYTSYQMYTGNKCVCRGDGKTATQYTDKGERTVECHPDTCDYLKTGKCKVSGILSCHIPLSMEVGGLYRFRTHSWNSVSNILASLNYISEQTRGILQGLPLKLKFLKKATADHGNVPTVTVVLDGIELLKMKELALAEFETRVKIGLDMKQLEHQAREAGILKETDTPADVQAEWYSDEPETVIDDSPGVSADAVSEKLDEKKPATKSEPESLL